MTVRPQCSQTAQQGERGCSIQQCPKFSQTAQFDGCLNDTHTDNTVNIPMQQGGKGGRKQQQCLKLCYLTSPYLCMGSNHA